MDNIKDLNPRGYPESDIITRNLQTLFTRLMELQDAFVDQGGKPFMITSGLRSEAQQADLIAQGKTKAVHSKHLAGWAADIYDPKRKLQAFIKKDPAILERIGLWCESFDHTATWVHVQATPPKSGKRFFIP
jgi:uncharacterized protein YcbK (DUF882 family)